MNSMADKLKAFERLLNIMDDLREGCPWDKKQTMETLRHLTIEAPDQCFTYCGIVHAYKGLNALSFPQT